MTVPTVMNGARAKLARLDPATGKATVVGIFNSVSWGLNYQTEPVYILGRYTAAEIDYTSQAPVDIRASGWRVIGHGAHKDGGVPELINLLTEPYISLTVLDRATDRPIATMHRVRATSYSTGVNARQLQEVQVSFQGILVDEDDVKNSEHGSAADLPVPG